jgi:translocation and assembly module TamA
MIVYRWIFFLLFFYSVVEGSEEIELPTHQITIHGQAYFDEAVLQDALEVKTKSFFQFWKEDTPLIKDKLIPSLEPALKNFYDSEGFYDANFTVEESNTTVTVNIKENKPVKIADINISSDYNITHMITLKKGAIFRAKDFIQVKSNIMKQLLDDGYCSYDLNTKAYVDLDKHRVDLVYALKKGEMCTFGEINIEGLESIDTDIVRSRVVANKGEKFDPKKIKESYARIYGLDAFDSVVVNTDRKFYNEVPVDIVLQELTKPYHYEIGAGYDTFVGARVHGLITKRNFLGNAQKITLKASWSQKEQLVELAFFKPYLFRLFGYGIDFGAKIGYSNLEYTGFQEKKSFLNTYLEHNEGRLKLKAGLGLENIEIALLDNLKNNQSLQQAIKEGTFVLFYPYLNAVYDARDDKLNPKYGYYLSAYVEYGLPYDEEASAYIKMLLEGRVIHTFGALTLASVAKFGVVDQTSHEVPESKLIFAGGSYYNRAYGYNKIGVILSPTVDTIQGASTLLNLSFEADYPIWGNLYGAVFTDNTMLTEESYDFDGDFITSAGVGVRYMTPIGPFKLDVGWNVHDTSQYGISFQIGQSF